MRRVAGFLVLLWTLAVVFAGTAKATNYPALDRVASHVAAKSVTIECETPEEWNNDPFAQGSWGYTFAGADKAWLDPSLCDSALALTTHRTYEPWQAAMAVLVLTHESFHMKDWTWNFNEGRVECQAIKHWPESFLMLSNWDTSNLWKLASFALAEHYQITTRFPDYFYKPCRIGWWPPWR